MSGEGHAQRFETVIVGAGQAGLSTGYHLARRERSFVILDAKARVGDTWRERWDSLRLFTPAAFDGLPGMRFPAPGNMFPTKDQMADYLEAYADWFELPVRTSARVTRVTRANGMFSVETTQGGEAGNGAGGNGDRFLADNVVIAMANYQRPRVPGFAGQLDPRIRQIHSLDYRNPDQLREGGVLIVGAGNSGAEIAMDIGRERKIHISGRDVGELPFEMDGLPARFGLRRIMLRFLFHRVLTVATPLGRKARPVIVSRGGPLIRAKRRHMVRIGVDFVPRVAGVRDGLPLLVDDRTLEVDNVVWCTGFDPGFDWIDLPIGSGHEPEHQRGVVPSVPGLYFVGLHFLHALSSAMIHGVGRDADRIAGLISARSA